MSKERMMSMVDEKVFKRLMEEVVEEIYNDYPEALEDLQGILNKATAPENTPQQKRIIVINKMIDMLEKYVQKLKE